MQLMIDVKTETPEALRLAASFLAQHAQLLDAIESVEPPAPPVPVFAPTPPVADAVAVAVADGDDDGDDETDSDMSRPAPATAYDSAGMPWDGRIHQRKRAVKKDGTWKIQKNLDPAIVTRVTQELHAASTPVPLTMQPPVPAVPVYVPPAPVSGASDASPQPLSEYRALVQKISKLREAGRLTSGQLIGALQAAGVPSLQMLGSMGHLVATVDTNIDVATASA